MRLERRAQASRRLGLTVPIVAVLLGLAVGGLVIRLGGTDPLLAYRTLFAAAFGSMEGWQATLTQAAPLMLTGLAVALPARMGLWNIGGEGQLTMGAVAATWVALYEPLPGWLLPVGMLLAAFAAGAVWALIAAVPRGILGLNEIIVTLFLNYIAVDFMGFLVNGPWGDKSAIGFAYSRAIPNRADLPMLAPSLSIGVLIAFAVALVAGWIVNRTPAGMTMRLVGSGTHVSCYLGLPIRRLTAIGFGGSGAIAGLAGAIQLMGVTQRLEPGISSNYGYCGILVAFLAAESITGVVVGAIIYGALIVGGLALQGAGVPFDISLVVQALTILFLVSGQAALRYRIAMGRGAGAAAIARAGR